jgi:hypothetical protein
LQQYHGHLTNHGHSRAVTSDTYTTVLPELALAAAEATAALVPLTGAGA